MVKRPRTPLQKFARFGANVVDGLKVAGCPFVVLGVNEFHKLCVPLKWDNQVNTDQNGKDKERERERETGKRFRFPVTIRAIRPVTELMIRIGIFGYPF